jgi:hypothetical protein
VGLLRKAGEGDSDDKVAQQAEYLQRSEEIQRLNRGFGGTVRRI